MMETNGITNANGEPRQHSQNHNRPVSFAGIGLDDVDGGASYLNSRPSTATSGKGGRQLTFRDYGERIKELEGENFQLKVRLHLVEQAKYGKSRNSNSQLSQNNTSGHDGLTLATNEIVSEFQQLKKDNETLHLKLVTAENQRLRTEEEKEEILRREQQHLSRNEELNHKLDVLDRELGLVKLKKDEEDDEIEKCVKAFNSFGGGGSCNSTYNNNNHLMNPTLEQNNILHAANETLESKMRELKNENEGLKSAVSGLQDQMKQKELENTKLLQKAQKRREQMSKLKEENYNLNVKVTTTCETMKEMGFQFNDMRSKNKNVLAENEMMKERISTQNTALEQAGHEINSLKRENAMLRDRVGIADKLQKEYGKLVTELKSLRSVCPVDETYERFVKVGLTRSVSHQELREDPSPDLGIETDHEALAQQIGAISVSVDNLTADCSSTRAFLRSNHHQCGEPERSEPDLDKEQLKRINKQLANKLKHAKQALDSTLTKLQYTTKEKEEFEQAMCRQLHKTHNLLEDAHQSIEDQEAQQRLCQCGKAV